MFHSFSSRTVMFFCILSFSLIHLCGCHAAPSETTAAVQTTEEAEDALTISSAECGRNHAEREDSSAGGQETVRTFH